MLAFDEESDRKFDKIPIPEGLTRKQIWPCLNIDDQHYFKDYLALPWLREILNP